MLQRLPGTMPRSQNQKSSTSRRSAVRPIGATLALLLSGSGLVWASGYNFVMIPASNCIQTNLISKVPEGLFTPVNPLQTPFTIASSPETCGYTGTGACNFYDAFSAAGQEITINVFIPHVTHIFTLMNAYHPHVGVHVATVTFIGSEGAHQSFSLIAGTNIRDFYHGNFANTLNNGIAGMSALNAYNCMDPATCLGVGGTGNVTTGSTGEYVVDEQAYSLESEFASQALVQIIITDTNSGAVPILLGITALSE
jgi:hypothetical protein